MVTVDESTPPESALIALAWPTAVRISSSLAAMKRSGSSAWAVISSIMAWPPRVASYSNRRRPVSG